MDVTFHLSRPSGELAPRRTATVVVRAGGACEVVFSDEPELAEVLAEVAKYDALPLRTETMERTPQGPILSMNEEKVARGDGKFGYAVGQLVANVCGCMVSFEPR